MNLIVFPFLQTIFDGLIKDKLDLPEVLRMGIKCPNHLNTYEYKGDAPSPLILEDSGRIIATPDSDPLAKETFKSMPTLKFFSMKMQGNSSPDPASFYPIQYVMSTVLADELGRLPDPEDLWAVWSSLKKWEAKPSYKDAIICSSFIKALKFHQTENQHLNLTQSNYHQTVSFERRLENVLKHSYTGYHKDFLYPSVIKIPIRLDLFPGVVFHQENDLQAKEYLFDIYNTPLVNLLLKRATKGCLCFTN